LSPDIDVDVFQTQLDVIGRLKHPIVVAIARDDLALATSQHLAGDIQRVGNAMLDNPRARQAIERYDLKVIDLSQVKGDPLGHNKFIEALPELEKIGKEESSNATSNAAPGIFTIDAAGDVISTPLRLGSALLAR